MKNPNPNENNYLMIYFIKFMSEGSIKIYLAYINLRNIYLGKYTKTFGISSRGYN